MSHGVAAETLLPPMVVHQARDESSEEPASRREQDPEPPSCSEAGGSSGDSGSPQLADAVPQKELPLLPSIKESMPFLSELSEAGAVAAGQEGPGKGAETSMDAKRERISYAHGSLQSGSASGPRELIPALLPASATTSTNSSPSVCPQRPPISDPVRADLKTPRSTEHSSTPECEGTDRVGGLDWSERRKKARREQTFQSTSPRVQRVSHLKLVVSKLLEALPSDDKLPFLESAKRYMAGELGPEDFAENVKDLVDKHSIVIAFECPTPAHDAQPQQNQRDDAVFVKPNGKRGAAGESAKGRGKSAKNDKAASPTSMGAAGAAAAGANLKKRKGAAGSGDGGSRSLPKSAKSGSYGEAGAASGKVLKGALTPVASAVVKDGGAAGDEENSAWDALLSVCALMPRQKGKGC